MRNGCWKKRGCSGDVERKKAKEKYRPHGNPHEIGTFMVGVIRFELTASWSRTKRATNLRYTPFSHYNLQH